MHGERLKGDYALFFLINRFRERLFDYLLKRRGTKWLVLSLLRNWLLEYAEGSTSVALAEIVTLFLMINRVNFAASVESAQDIAPSNRFLHPKSDETSSSPLVISRQLHASLLTNATVTSGLTNSEQLKTLNNNDRSMFEEFMLKMHFKEQTSELSNFNFSHSELNFNSNLKLENFTHPSSLIPNLEDPAEKQNSDDEIITSTRLSEISLNCTLNDTNLSIESIALQNPTPFSPPCENKFVIQSLRGSPSAPASPSFSVPMSPIDPRSPKNIDDIRSNASYSLMLDNIRVKSCAGTPTESPRVAVAPTSLQNMSVTPMPSFSTSDLVRSGWCDEPDVDVFLNFLRFFYPFTYPKSQKEISKLPDLCTAIDVLPPMHVLERFLTESYCHGFLILSHIDIYVFVFDYLNKVCI